MEDKILSARTELERLERWGGVDTDDLAFLQDKNIALSLYEIPTDKYASLGEEIKTIFVNRDKNITRFLLIEKDGDATQNVSDKAFLPPEAYAVPLPSVSTRRLAEDIEQLSAAKKQTAEKITSSAVYAEAIKKAAVLAEKALEFENLNSGMGRDEAGEYALAWLTGFIPASDLAS